MEGSKKRVGTNMKPRQTIEKTEDQAVIEEKEVSSDGGFVVPHGEAPAEPQVDGLDDSPLEGEEPVATIPKTEAEMALEDALKASQEGSGEENPVIPATVQNLEWEGAFRKFCAGEPSVVEPDSNPPQIHTSEIGTFTPEQMEELLRTGEFKNPIDAIMITIPKIGPLPDGDYGVVVRIAEGYWPGVEEQAKLDGKTMEDWMTDFVSTCLESYFHGA